MKHRQVTLSDFKKHIIANAVATGNTFAFRDLFSRLAEAADVSADSNVPPEVTEHLDYLLPTEESSESPEFKAALELIEKYELDGDTVPAAILEATAKRAVRLGKFAYAEDAYKLLGIKKEMVALYAQTGEQFLRDDKPANAAISFLVAASLNQPVGPHFQLTGPRLHARCLMEPKNCVTTLPIEAIVDTGIHLLLSSESLSDRLIASARPEQKAQILATLATCREMDLPGLVGKLRAAAAELAGLEDGKPDDYASIGPTLLGRETASGEAWQYLRELCFEHPIAALCVCTKLVRDTPILVPIIRDGKPLIEHLLPAELMDA